MSSTKFISFLSLLATFLLIPFALTSPALRRAITPGSGHLVALKDGCEVGCLDSSWKLVVGPEGCGVFNVAQKPGRPRYYGITSEKGSCAYKDQPVVPQPEQNIFLLACGVKPGVDDFLDTQLQFFNGTGANANQSVLSVAANSIFTTVGEKFPVGTEALDVTTDIFVLPNHFEIGWKRSV